MRWLLLLVLAGCTTEDATCQCQAGELTIACGQTAIVDGECVTCTGANLTAPTPGLCDAPPLPGDVDMAYKGPSLPDLSKADAKPSNPPATCPAGLTNCAGLCVDLYSDSDNCGACGSSCNTLPNVYKGYASCDAGQCKIASNGCNYQYYDCNGDAHDGCEALLTSPDHCGDCATQCSGNTPACVYKYGDYACDSGCGYSTPSLCSGSCVDTSSNLNHCGMCGNACVAPAHGAVTCQSYACKVTCDAGYVVCPAGCCPGWPVATADPLLGNGAIGRGDLVLDANKVEHVAYVSKKLQELIYWRSDTATLERIDGPFAPGATVEDVRIVRTSDGALHVVYQVQQVGGAPQNRDLWHAQRGASSWSKDKVDSSPQLSGAQLAPGALGSLFLFFTHTYSPKVNRLVTRAAGGTYTSEDLSTDGNYWQLSSTPGGVAALAYSTSASAVKVGLHGASGFSFEDVGQTGYVSGLSYDPAGHPYVTFTSGSTPKEAHKLDTFWETLTVGASSSIRFDSGGAAWASGVTYYSPRNLYLQKFTTTWANSGTPVSLGSSDVPLSFQLDPTAVPHYLVAANYSSTALNALQPGKTVKIDSERKPGASVQMAADSGGTTHMVYSDAATYELWYATLKGGVWTQEKLPITGSTFRFALSSAGVPGVCQAAGSSLSYATRSGGVWSSETVTGVSSAAGCSLTLDGNSKPHLGYSYGSSYAMHVGYAKKTSTVWEKLDVEAVNNTSAETLIALEPATGSPHVAFYSSGSLILGRWNGTRFVQQTLASGLSPSGNFYYDSAGTAHLLASGTTYASIVGTTFASEPLITEPGRTGSGVLVLGPQGPIVALLSSYYGQTDYRLAIAKKAAGSWSTENVAALAPASGPALALASGKLVAGLYDTTYGRLLIAAQP